MFTPSDEKVLSMFEPNPGAVYVPSWADIEEDTTEDAPKKDDVHEVQSEGVEKTLSPIPEHLSEENIQRMEQCLKQCLEHPENVDQMSGNLDQVVKYVKQCSEQNQRPENLQCLEQGAVQCLGQCIELTLELFSQQYVKIIPCFEECLELFLESGQFSENFEQQLDQCSEQYLKNMQNLKQELGQCSEQYSESMQLLNQCLEQDSDLLERFSEDMQFLKQCVKQTSENIQCLRQCLEHGPCPENVQRLQQCLEHTRCLEQCIRQRPPPKEDVEEVHVDRCVGLREVPWARVDLEEYINSKDEDNEFVPLFNVTPPVLSLDYENDPQISLCDQNGTLSLYCYTRCNDSSPDYVKHMRGVVFSKDEIVSRGFSYTPDYVTLPDSLTEYLKKEIKNCIVYKSFEGATVRLFFHGGRWYLITNRKLNAFTSFWSSHVSFGTMFIDGLKHLNSIYHELQVDNEEDIFDVFTSRLNTEYQYIFLLLNSKENRIVSDEGAPRVYHIATFDKTGVQGMYNLPMFPKPLSDSFDTLEELLQSVDTLDYRFYQGYLIHLPNGTQVKLYSKQYHHLYRLRNNVMSRKFRYLQVRTDTSKVEEYLSLYPDMQEEFLEYEKLIISLVAKLYHSYVARYIRKKFVVVPQDEFTILKAVHNWYQNQQTEKRNRVTLDVVSELVNKQSPSLLNGIIKRMKKYNNE